MRCVYTVLLGGYESLTEQPVAHSSTVDFICLTDDPKLSSDTWKIQLTSPHMPDDSIRSQRYLKIIGHESLKKYSQTLYIDNSVLLTTEPEDIFAKYGNKSALALPLHSFRTSVDDEYREITALYLDDPKVIAEQRQRYSQLCPEVFAQKPYWTAILLRDYSMPELQPLMEMWWSEVCHFSRRDQLSINAALELSQVVPFAYQIDNYRSWFHTWPVARDKREDVRHWQGRIPTQPSVMKRIVGQSAYLAKKLKIQRQK
jgi:hypothetical protein